jgi:hypothetical protein
MCAKVYDPTLGRVRDVPTSPSKSQPKSSQPPNTTYVGKDYFSGGGSSSPPPSKPPSSSSGSSSSKPKAVQGVLDKYSNLVPKTEQPKEPTPQPYQQKYSTFIQQVTGQKQDNPNVIQSYQPSNKSYVGKSQYEQLKEEQQSQNENVSKNQNTQPKEPTPSEVISAKENLLKTGFLSGTAKIITQSSLQIQKETMKAPDYLYKQKYKDEISAWEDVNRKLADIESQRGVQLFTFDDTGTLIVNPNVPEKSKKEVAELGEKYGLDIGTQYAPQVDLVIPVSSYDTETGKEGITYVVNPYLPSEYKGLGKETAKEFNLEVGKETGYYLRLNSEWSKSPLIDIYNFPPAPIKEYGFVNVLQWDKEGTQTFGGYLKGDKLIGGVPGERDYTFIQKDNKWIVDPKTIDIGFTSLSDIEKYKDKPLYQKVITSIGGKYAQDGITFWKEQQQKAQDKASEFYKEDIKLGGFTLLKGRDYYSQDVPLEQVPAKWGTLLAYDFAEMVYKAPTMIAGGFTGATAQLGMGVTDYFEGRESLAVTRGIKAGQEAFEPTITLGALAFGVFPGLKGVALSGASKVLAPISKLVSVVPGGKYLGTGLSKLTSTISKVPGSKDMLVSSAYLGTALGVGETVLKGEPITQEVIGRSTKYTSGIFFYRALASSPVKYDTLTIPMKTPTGFIDKTVYRGVYYQPGEKPITMLVGKGEKGLVIGTPGVKDIPSYAKAGYPLNLPSYKSTIKTYPSTALETKILQRPEIILSRGVKGYSLTPAGYKGFMAPFTRTSIVEGSRITNLIEKAVREVQYLRSVRSGSLTDIKIKGLTPKESKDITSIFLKKETKFLKGYGSSFEQTARPSIYQRPVGDIEAYYSSTSEVDDVVKQLLKLKKIKGYNINIKYSPTTGAPQTATLTKGSETFKIAEFKIKGLPDADTPISLTGKVELEPQIFGFKSYRSPIIYEGKPVQSLFEQTLIKGGSSVKRFETIKGGLTIQTSASRLKDPVDFVAQLKTYAYYNPASAPKLTKIASEVQKYYMQTQPGTIPLFKGTPGVELKQIPSLYSVSSPSPSISPSLSLSASASAISLPSPSVFAPLSVSPPPSPSKSISPSVSPSTSIYVSPSPVSPPPSPSVSVLPSISLRPYKSPSPSPTKSISPSVMPKSPSVSPSVSPKPVSPSISPKPKSISPSPSFKLSISPTSIRREPPPPTKEIIPVPKFEYKYKPPTTKLKTPKSSIKRVRGERLIVPDWLSVAKTEIEYGKAKVRSLTTKEAYKYEVKGTGRIPTLQLARDKKKKRRKKWTL